MERAEFRDRAERHLKLAIRHYDNNEAETLPAACLELRMAIECLAYQLVLSYQDEVDMETLEKWQPGKLIDELKEIDEYADKDVSISVKSEEADGPSSKEMRHLGTSNRMDGAWVKKNYAALGNFVHEGTIAQIRSGQSRKDEAVRKKFQEVRREIERVLTGNLWALRIRATVSFFCNCGFKVVRRERLLKKDGRVKCANCGEIVGATLEGEQWKFYLQGVPVKCPHDGCLHETVVPERRIHQGEVIECEGCHSEILIEQRLCAVKGATKDER